MVCRPDEQMDANLDYETYKVDLNNKSIKVKDGRFKIIIAHKEPPAEAGIENWLRQVG